MSRLVSFVIPCYNSSRTLGKVVEEIRSTMEGMKQYDYEIILINDCSPDDTFEKIRNICEADEMVCGVNLARNF